MVSTAIQKTAETKEKALNATHYLATRLPKGRARTAGTACMDTARAKDSIAVERKRGRGNKTKKKPTVIVHERTFSEQHEEKRSCKVWCCVCVQ